MVTVRLFAQAREAAGQSSISLDAETVADAVAKACDEFGDNFKVVLKSSNIWLNGSPTNNSVKLTEADELAILPPVSGG